MDSSFGKKKLAASLIDSQGNKNPVPALETEYVLTSGCRELSLLSSAVAAAVVFKVLCCANRDQFVLFAKWCTPESNFFE